MKIDGNGRIGGPSGPGAKRGTGGGGQFSVPDLDEARPAVSVGAAAPMGGVASLFALQEVDVDGERRRAARRGHDVLDRLEELRMGLLFGHVPKEKLHDLLNLVRSRQEKLSDPRLISVLADIELRAEVELAKLGF
ncbi:flagellar assembly protein FliX [Oleomonas cavernae]|uniref:Flagellar assembly protein FliX n=1 Tax=Oleomonas cavernae TaxID=2320859 RepID=A0A418WAW0_9PROT|nr:flagellar assembly protein FliX [Oleomonas cavernae]RJF87104.1 flagellar assembly protein FliX [Oleomonas cavernae]